MVVALTYASVTDYVLVVVFGGLVGTAELVARYRDAPMKALATVPAALYVGVNGAASAGALALIHVFNWDFGQSGDAKRFVQVVAAGFGALAIFRTSLFIVRAGDQDVGVGPSSFLQVMLSAADRAVDRMRARSRAMSAEVVMADVSFDKAHAALPAYCLALMQNVSPEDQADLARDIEALRAANMNDSAKVLNLGLVLMNIVGPTVLRSAVKSLRPVITVDGPALPPATGGPAPTDGAGPLATDTGLPPVPPMPGPGAPDAPAPG